MRMEVSEDVLAAIKAVAEWCRGCDGPDEIIEHDLPVIDVWLVGLGLLPPPTQDPGETNG
jgi:hypothetical protein